MKKTQKVSKCLCFSFGTCECGGIVQMKRIGTDLDAQMIQYCQNKLKQNPIDQERFHFLNKNFAEVNSEFLQSQNLPSKFDMVVADLGFSR